LKLASYNLQAATAIFSRQIDVTFVCASH